MPPRRSWLAILCALGASAGFAVAVQGASWWSIGGEVGIGPMTSRHCFGGNCTRTGLGWANGSDTWVRAGAATYAGGLLAALLLVMLAGALAARSSGRLLAVSAAVATLTSAVVGAVFVTGRPPLVGSSMGHGLPLFVAAVDLAVMAIAATLWRARRPLDPPA